jgi:hypothetical protein
MESDVGWIGWVVPLVMIATAIGLFWAIADILRRTGTDWDASGQSQGLWIIVVILSAPLGPILYGTIARPRLKRALLR